MRLWFVQKQQNTEWRNMTFTGHVKTASSNFESWIGESNVSFSFFSEGWDLSDEEMEAEELTDDNPEEDIEVIEVQEEVEFDDSLEGVVLR